MYTVASVVADEVGAEALSAILLQTKLYNVYLKFIFALFFEKMFRTQFYDVYLFEMMFRTQF